MSFCLTSLRHSAKLSREAREVRLTFWTVMEIFYVSFRSQLVCRKLTFRLTADVWRPGGCRLFAVVCHISVHVTQPETELEARHIATICFSVCILLGTKQAVEHMWESGSHWYILNVADNCKIKCSMGNGAHRHIWLLHFQFRGTNLSALECWCTNKYQQEYCLDCGMKRKIRDSVRDESDMFSLPVSFCGGPYPC